MRKKNLSVYDIQRTLAEAGHSISINALSVLMREEGFARLPRRRDDERPSTVKPEDAQVADVRALDLSPRTFRTRVGGLLSSVNYNHRPTTIKTTASFRPPWGGREGGKKSPGFLVKTCPAL
jgi:hypothetical protein